MWSKILLVSIFGFSSSITSSFDLRGVINGDRMAGVPLGMSLGAGEVDVEGICTQSGMACQNCTHAVTCVALPFAWLKVPLEECGDGRTCNAHLGKCSTTPVPECDVKTQQYSHSCEQVGIFPDAHDCRKFHLCSPPQGLPDGRPAMHGVALCPRHYAFNPQTAQCSIELPKGQCPNRPVPDCLSLGASGALLQSTNHYYVCLMKKDQIVPQIFVCPHGWHFWDGFCRPEPPTETKIEPKTELKTKISTEKDSDKSSEDQNSVDSTPTPATEKSTPKFFLSFFSTEKTSTYPADTFLADKFDLTNYETTDDVQGQEDFVVNSFESNEW